MVSEDINVAKIVQINLFVKNVENYQIEHIML